ncbi:hypothetical protein N7495_003502 [Penicillium taxi]|uniref:uncharacterized protein n=1 Tax=Penicillium taxi TaxID=168475 RepID=UPI0025453E37|nr:uncharacterized protein N7495_003502 [Penicillium taxi]KAJ5898758.1 hypothetical protein N7495_003502 [Penicillium taxi]
MLLAMSVATIIVAVTAFCEAEADIVAFEEAAKDIIVMLDKHPSWPARRRGRELRARPVCKDIHIFESCSRSTR